MKTRLASIDKQKNETKEAVTKNVGAGKKAEQVKVYWPLVQRTHRDRSCWKETVGSGLQALRTGVRVWVHAVYTAAEPHSMGK